MLNFVFKEFSGKCLLAIAMLLCLSGFVGAQTPPASWLTDVERAKFEKLRIAGSEALFNLDYEKGRKHFREVARLFPDHPAGPQFLAATFFELRKRASRSHP